MLVIIYEWRAAIGLFEVHKYVAINKKKTLKYSNLKPLTIFLFLVQHGDIEINLGRRKKQLEYFSCCHYNVNSLITHNKIVKYHC